MPNANTLNFFVPADHNDPVGRPDKFDMGEAIVEKLNETVLDGIGCVIAGQTITDGELIVETWPVDPDRPGTDFRIVITRLRSQIKQNPQKPK